MAGVIRANRQNEDILGLGYKATPRLTLQLDHQGGGSNFYTAGFTVNATNRLQINPALYFANRGHKVHGYVVFTWNLI